MKKLITISLAVILCGAAYADIQSSLSSRFNWSRKLSRAICNIAYSPSEILTSWSRSNIEEGNIAAGGEIIGQGVQRTLVRIGYGLYEVATFPVHSYKGTYRPPFYKKGAIDPWRGYDEFPPQVGIQAHAAYSRHQVW